MTNFDELFFEFVGIEIILMIVIDLSEGDLDVLDESGILIDELDLRGSTSLYSY